MQDDGANIGFYVKDRLVVCERTESAGGRRSDAGQLLQFLKVFGKFPAVLLDDLFARSLDEQCAPVVSESLPYFEDVRLVGFGDGLCGGKLLDELCVPYLYAVDLRLLEHHLGHEYPVRIRDVAPGHGALVVLVVLEHVRLELADLGGGYGYAAGLARSGHGYSIRILA